MSYEGGFIPFKAHLHLCLMFFILTNANESASIVVVFEAISNSRFIKSVKNVWLMSFKKLLTILWSLGLKLIGVSICMYRT